MTRTKNYYAGYSYMGTDFSRGSGCWCFYVFETPEDREIWMDENRYNTDGIIVAEEITRKEALRILKPTKWQVMFVDYTSGNLVRLCEKTHKTVGEYPNGRFI